jgi:hypothetical protein
MIGKIGILAAATVWSVSAGAQEAASDPPATKPVEADAPGADTLANPKAIPRAACGGACTLTLSVTPDMTYARPFGDEDFTDALTLNSRFAITREFLSRPKVKDRPQPAILDTQMEIGSTLKLDGDDGGTNSTSSSIGASLRINYRPIPRFTLFASYGVKAAFTGRFRDDNGSEQTFAAGASVTFCKENCRLFVPATTLTLQLANVNSTNPADDVTSYQATTELSWDLRRVAERSPPWLPIPDPFLNVEASRRVFDHPDPVSGLPRRDWNYSIFGGLDFTRWLMANLISPRVAPFVKSVRIGFRYIENLSNIDTNDKATRAILPSITFRSTF